MWLNSSLITPVNFFCAEVVTTPNNSSITKAINLIGIAEVEYALNIGGINCLAKCPLLI